MAWSPSRVVAPPSEEPITLAEARKQCRLESTDEDGALLGFIVAARMHVESYCGIRLTTQTVEMSASQFCDLEHPATAPLQSIEAIEYLDTAGDLQTLAPETYELAGNGLTPVIRTQINQRWPVPRPVAGAIKVTAVAGFGDAEDVPADLRHALLLLIGHWYATRESVITGTIATELPMGVEALLCNHRRSS